jgi:hypothetical protein
VILASRRCSARRSIRPLPVNTRRAILEDHSLCVAGFGRDAPRRCNAGHYVDPVVSEPAVELAVSVWHGTLGVADPGRSIG